MNQDQSSDYFYAFSISLNDEFSNYRDLDEKKLERITSLSRVNLLVGPNNSGKSRFLRTLSRTISKSDIDFSFSGVDFNEIDSLLSKIKNAPNIQRLSPIFTEPTHRRTSTPAVLIKAIPNPLSRTFDSKKLESFHSQVQQSIRALNRTNVNSEFTRNIVSDVKQDLIFLKKVFDKAPKELPSKPIYIPILRGLRPLVSTEQHPIRNAVDAPTPYESRTESDYFLPSEESPGLFTGESLYWVVRNMLLGTEKERQKISAFEDYLSKTFFSQGGHRTVTLIPRIDSDVLFVKIGDEAEKPIYDLGDGIQQLIILTFLTFTEESAIFFIEEPDICLHPGMQRMLMECFCAHPEHQFFLTTHSNHLLDLTLDFDQISIFRFEKQAQEPETASTPTFRVDCVENGDDSVLKQLGVRNSSVFLVNATIWVEGITDRTYLRHYFDLWQKKKQNEAIENEGHFTTYQEDLHYAFVEYGGGNIMHFFDVEDEDSEEDNPERPHDLDRLCGRAFLVMDDDGDKKQARKERLQNILGNRLHILGCREIENLLPPRVLKAIINCREKEAFEFPKDVIWADYAKQYLGRWIEDNVVDETNYKYADDDGSGTLYSSQLKRRFAMLTTQHFGTDDFHEPIEKLMQDLYDHIKAQIHG